MAQVSLKAERRERLGKEQVKKLRSEGKVPGVVYGRHLDAPIPIELDEREVFHLTHGSHAGSLESIVIDLEIKDGRKKMKRPALIKEVQTDPLRGIVLHIDLNEISLKEKIHARVPVVHTGECKGEKVGGILEHRSGLDKTIQGIAANWEIARMPIIDRNILRLAAYEILHCEDIPRKVAINEAIDLAKKYSTKESGAFVNGILDKVVAPDKK